MTLLRSNSHVELDSHLSMWPNLKSHYCSLTSAMPSIGGDYDCFSLDLMLLTFLYHDINGLYIYKIPAIINNQLLTIN